MRIILILGVLSILIVESKCSIGGNLHKQSEFRDLSMNQTMKMSCPPGVREVNCFVDPCFNKVCSANPSATCISNYCGGCNALWINAKGKQVRCNRKRISQCPPGVNIVRCFKDPCQGETCPGDSSAKCVSNYCGGCNFSWKKSNGQSAQCS